MNLKYFLQLFDDWNSNICVNGDDLNKIVETTGLDLYENYTNLHKRTVVAFGVYDNQLCVRVL